MIRHIGINVSDLVKAKYYYDNLLPSLGFELHIVAEDQFAYRPSDNQSGPSIFFYPALEDERYSSGTSPDRSPSGLIPDL